MEAFRADINKKRILPFSGIASVLALAEALLGFVPHYIDDTEGDGQQDAGDLHGLVGPTGKNEKVHLSPGAQLARFERQKRGVTRRAAPELGAMRGPE